MNPNSQQVDHRLESRKQNHNYEGTSKIDSESIVQQYRSLKQEQKQFLRRINISPALKKELFDLDQIKDPKNVRKQKLVVVLDPFRGRLVMRQTAWLQLYAQKQSDRQKYQDQMKLKQEQKEQQMFKQDIIYENEQKIEFNEVHSIKSITGEHQQKNFITNILGNLFQPKAKGAPDFQSEENLKKYQKKDNKASQQPKKQVENNNQKPKSKFAAFQKSKLLNYQVDKNTNLKEGNRLSATIQEDQKEQLEQSKGNQSNFAKRLPSDERIQKAARQPVMRNERGKKIIQEQISSIRESGNQNKIQTESLQSMLKLQKRKR